MKPMFWLGELDPIEHPEYMGTFDAAYTWTWMHRTEEFYKKQLPINVLDSVLQEYDAIGDASMRIWFTSNHDENSWNGSEYQKYGDMAKALAVFSCTWNGLPLIYSGQELPNLKRLKFFEKDEINWSGNYELHDFYKRLLNLHSANPALRAGDTQSKTQRLKTTDQQQVFAYIRQNCDHQVLVILNLSNLDVEFALESVTGAFKEIFSGAKMDFAANKDFKMRRWEYYVFEKMR